MTSDGEARLPADDPELVALVNRYVKPGNRYLTLLHGNFLRKPNEERRAFIDNLRRDAEAITDHDLDILLSSEWRSRLTGSWLIAASRRTPFVQRLRDLLIASELANAGQGYCIALGAIGDESATQGLVAYLDHWLPQHERRFDQPWAMAALVCIDERKGSDFSARFLRLDGLWQAWTYDDSTLEHEVRTMRDALDALRS